MLAFPHYCNKDGGHVLLDKEVLDVFIVFYIPIISFFFYVSLYLIYSPGINASKL
jgi:hypothetical protein